MASPKVIEFPTQKQPKAAMAKTLGDTIGGGLCAWPQGLECGSPRFDEILDAALCDGMAPQGSIERVRALVQAAVLQLEVLSRHGNESVAPAAAHGIADSLLEGEKELAGLAAWLGQRVPDAG